MLTIETFFLLSHSSYYSRFFFSSYSSSLPTSFASFYSSLSAHTFWLKLSKEEAEEEKKKDDVDVLSLNDNHS